MESQPLINPQIFAAADAIVAAFLAIGFAAAFTFERRLNAVAWWAGGYALLSLSFVLTGLRYPEPVLPVLVLSWVSMLGASSLFLGGVVQVQSKTRPKRLIAATALVSAPMIVAFPIMGAPLMVWEAVSHGLAAVVAGFAGFAILSGEKPQLRNIFLASGFFGFAALLILRGFWFVSAARAVAAGEPFDSFVEALLMVILTVVVMVGLATAMMLRSALLTFTQLQEASSRDGLSGLLTRAAFDEKAERSFGSPENAKQPVCVMIADLDHFKKVNDTLGHQAGDMVITAFGELLAGVVADDQVAGRIGGEEFAVLLPGATVATARLFGETVRTGMRQIDLNGMVPWTVTVSIGIAQRQAGEPLHSVIARADRALYAAKSNGRDRVMVDAVAGDTDNAALSA